MSQRWSRYQIILLGDRGTCVCVNNLPKVVTRRCPSAESNLRLSGLQVRHITVRLRATLMPVMPGNAIKVDINLNFKTNKCWKCTARWMAASHVSTVWQQLWMCKYRHSTADRTQYHSYMAGSTYHVIFIGTPFLEDLQWQTTMKHARGCHHNHGTWIVGVRTLEWLQNNEQQRYFNFSNWLSGETVETFDVWSRCRRFNS